MKLTSLLYHNDSSVYFNALANLAGCVWLDSGKPHSNDGRYDILTALPTETCTNLDLKALQATLNQKLNSHAQASTLPFCGGWIGFLGYEYTHCNFGLAAVEPYHCNHSWFGWYDWAIIQDHHKATATLVITEQCSEATRLTVADLLASISTSTETNTSNNLTPQFNCAAFKSDEPKYRYLENVAQIQSYILAGDCYQTNYTQRFSAQFSGSAASAYLKLRQATPNPYCAYLALPNNTHILSLSQERFLEIDQHQAITNPIKGTIARGKNIEHDDQLKHELYSSVKNRAENLMIVDLLRNDFSKNCLPYSVKTPQLFSLKSYSNVHHLVSTVTGTLKEDTSHVQFLMDCFPGGSITGAPKKRAMEIIAELESNPRGPYCGAIGYFSANQHTDFNISIRTFLQEESKIYCWAGGGVVADSVPEAEYQESLQKITALLNTLSSLEENFVT